MTDKEKAQAYDEALERARKQKYDYQKELDKTDKNSQLAGILRAGISAIELAFPELAENEDEKIRKELWEYFHNLQLSSDCDFSPSLTIDDILAYLEKQKEPIDPFDTKLFQDGVKEGRRLEREEMKKEPIPIPDKFSGLKSLMLQYLQSAANRTDDTEIESDTDLWGRKILDYVWKYSEKQKKQKPAENLDLDNASQDYVYNYFCPGADFTPDYIKGLLEDAFIDGANWQKEQQPAEWSEEDEKVWQDIFDLCNRFGYDDACRKLKSLRPHWKPSEVCYGAKGDPDPAGVWKPSEEQIKALQMVKDSHCFMYQKDRVAIEKLLEQIKSI